MTSSKLLLSALFLAGAAHPALALDAPQLVQVKVLGIFAPVGFDDNDEVEVVVTGALPDTCYKMADTKFEIARDHAIHVTQWARKFSGQTCFKVYVPFTAVVHVGVLAAGMYDIVANGGALTKTLAVDRAVHPWEVDEHLYAPVDQATTDHVEETEVDLILQGRFTNTCLSLNADDVQVIQSGNVLEVLPIMKMAAGAGCQPTEVPFSVRVKLPVLDDGPYLAHVRSMSGQAIETMFYMLNE